MRAKTNAEVDLASIIFYDPKDSTEFFSDKIPAKTILEGIKHQELRLIYSTLSKQAASGKERLTFSTRNNPVSTLTYYLLSHDTEMLQRIEQNNYEGCDDFKRQTVRNLNNCIKDAFLFSDYSVNTGFYARYVELLGKALGYLPLQNNVFGEIVLTKN
jgi:hypothetical protein